MIILKRGVGATLVTREWVKVVVLGVTRNQARIGTAANALPVHRDEIYERIRRESVAATENKR